MSSLALKRRRAPSPTENQDEPMRTTHRLYRPLPKRRLTSNPRRPTAPGLCKAFTQYRSVSNTSSDFTDASPGTTESELGSSLALSDVESEIQGSTRDGSSPVPSRDVDDEIDTFLLASSRESPPPFTHWGLDAKGKRVDPREYGDRTAKRARSDPGSDGDEGDDESVTYKAKKKPCRDSEKRTILGQTKSIFEITWGMDNLGDDGQINMDYYESDEGEDDELLVSASLLASSPSPVEHLAKRLPKQCPTKRLVARRAVQSRRTRLPFYHVSRRGHGAASRRPVPNSLSEDEKMITSDIEREMLAVDNEVQRRTRLREYSARLPGQKTTSHLRRMSPTSLLPLRERRKHLSTMRPKRNVHTRVMVGQLLLAALHDARHDRIQRRDTMLAHNKRAQSARLLPAAPIWETPKQIRVTQPVHPPTPPHITVPVRLVQPRETHLRRINLHRQRECRDLRRRTADRQAAERTGIIRLAAPTISPPSIAVCLPHTDSLQDVAPRAAPSVTRDEDGQVETIVPDPRSGRAPSPALSDPPEYEPPPVPVTLPVPRHLRPRRLARSSGRPEPVPSYPWLSPLSGGEYSRHSPSPPPPFNALTDSHTLIAPVFIDEDDEDDEWMNHVAPSGFRPPSPGMVGSFPLTSHANPSIVAPVPMRAFDFDYHVTQGRSAWEAALDLEEGAEEDMVEGAFGEEVEVQVEVQVEVTSVEVGGTLGSLGRWIGRLWR